MKRSFFFGSKSAVATVIVTVSHSHADETVIVDPDTPKCVKQEIQHYVGLDATALDQIKFGDNVNIRIIRPNTMVTQDYLTDRTNIHIDQNEKIVRVVCG